MISTTDDVIKSSREMNPRFPRHGQPIARASQNSNKARLTPFFFFGDKTLYVRVLQASTVRRRNADGES
jgi:hypothetical protein